MKIKIKTVAWGKYVLTEDYYVMVYDDGKKATLEKLGLLKKVKKLKITENASGIYTVSDGTYKVKRKNNNKVMFSREDGAVLKKVSLDTLRGMSIALASVHVALNCDYSGFARDDILIKKASDGKSLSILFLKTASDGAINFQEKMRWFEKMVCNRFGI